MKRLKDVPGALVLTAPAGVVLHGVAHGASAHPDVAATRERLLTTARTDSPEFALHEKKNAKASRKP